MINNCPCCNNKAAVDFEKHVIYCTACSIAVQDTEKDLDSLAVEWNDICKNILINLKDLDPEFSKAVDENFWDLIQEDEK